MSDEPSPLKEAIMEAVYTPLERDDMQTPCTLPFMTSSEHGVCDGNGCPVSDESIASALNAVAKIQTEYYKVKKETQKGTQKEMTDEASPRPWQVRYGDTVADATGAKVAACLRPENAALIADAVNEHDKLKAECDRLRTAYADLWRAVKRIEADSRLGLGTGLEVASSALHYVHTYASSAISAAKKKGFAPEIGKDQK